MLGIVADLAIEGDDLAFRELSTLSHIDGAQTLLAQLAVFQAADTPERLDNWLARLHGYGAFLDANIEILREGMASGRTSARIVAERTIRQLEGLARPARRGVAGGHDVPGRGRRRPGAGPGGGARRRPPGGPAVPGHAPRRVPPVHARGAGPALRAGWRGPVPLRDPLLDDARHGPPRRPPGGPRRAGPDRRRAAGDRARRGLRRRRGRLPPGPGHRSSQPGRDAGGARRARHGGHHPGRRGRAAGLRPPPARRLRGPPGRGVQGEGRSIRVLLPADAGRFALAASTTSTPTTCRAARTPSWRPRPTTRRSRATTSRSAWRWSTPRSTSSDASARG